MSTSETTALILILHGSPKESSSAPARLLADSLRESSGYRHVMLAFMECNKPTIAEAVKECAALDVTTIIAVPYLLHTGRHLVLDIPDALKAAAGEYPHLAVLITNPVGAAEATSEALAGRATEALDN